MEPTKGTFKVQTVGPKKNIPNKKDPNNPWASWSLQFEDDPNWYDTFWLAKEDPIVGQELTGTKSYDDKWNTYKLELDRQGGKSNWNPAAAQATVMTGAANVVAGFLSLPGHYELWASPKSEDAKKLKAKFDKYLVTVEVVAKRLKDSVVGMGSMQPEQKTATKSAAPDGDPGPTPPPDIEETWADGEEQVDL